MLRRVRADHDLPAVPRLVGSVHDEHPGRATALRLLELVRPPSVVGHGLAAEERLLGRGGGWIVDEDEEHLALEIGPLEVVPLVLRRARTIANEHQLAACAALWRRAATPDHDLVRLAKGRRRL